MISVAFDFTHALINRTGVGRYPRELLGRLQNDPGLRMLPMAAPGAGRSTSTAAWAAEVGRRDFAYYPFGLGLRASRAGARLVHVPATAPVRTGDLPVVISVHDLLWLRLPQYFTRPVRAYHRLSLPAIRRADCVLASSHHTRRDLIELVGVPEERVRVAHLGVDPRFAPRDPEPALLRERFGVRGRYVLAVATREPRKNLGTLLRAFERVAARLDDAELVLAGGRGWRSAELERTLEAVGDRVKVCGFVTDEELAQLYAGAACFAFPSLAEGFGLPVLEAMASGVPVVSGDRTSLPEVVGDAGLLVDPTDEEALADALARLLEDRALAGDLARRGLERSRAFSWEACAAVTADAYRSTQ
jgi:alpha-1,3-rhamnosyl/mannosyltransferase